MGSNLLLYLRGSTVKRQYWRQQTKSSKEGAHRRAIDADFKTPCDAARNWTALFRIRCQKHWLLPPKRSDHWASYGTSRGRQARLNDYWWFRPELSSWKASKLSRRPPGQNGPIDEWHHWCWSECMSPDVLWRLRLLYFRASCSSYKSNWTFKKEQAMCKMLYALHCRMRRSFEVLDNGSHLISCLKKRCGKTRDLIERYYPLKVAWDLRWP